MHRSRNIFFPGGTFPSLREILNHMAKDNFHTLDMENLHLHYNKTLLHWEKDFRDNIEKEKTMFDEEFLRMWDMYCQHVRQPSTTELSIFTRFL